MKSIFALFVRSLREDTRRRSTYVARTGIGLLMLLLLAMTQAVGGWGGAPGLRFFSQTLFLNFFFISFVGFSYFSSAVTEEKE